MEFVDKSNTVYPHRLLKNFLDRCAACTPYPNDLYEAMKSDVESDGELNPNRSTTYRLLLQQILDDSRLGRTESTGQGYCSYCMRTIKAESSHSTLEHVIPNRTENEEDFNNYFAVPTSLVHNPNVLVYRDVFITRHHCLAPPFPHNVAYENLVASCDGCLPLYSTNHVCCNSYRGQNGIPPLMFIPNIHQEIKYHKNGVMVWSDNPNVDKRERCRVINDALNLNCEILMMIRRIWCYLSENGLDHNLDTGERRRVIDTLRFQVPAIEKEILQNFDQDNYWNLLGEYTYFNDIAKFS